MLWKRAIEQWIHARAEAAATEVAKQLRINRLTRTQLGSLRAVAAIESDEELGVRGKLKKFVDEAKGDELKELLGKPGKAWKLLGMEDGAAYCEFDGVARRLVLMHAIRACATDSQRKERRS